jgi:hypothetical protein
MNGCFKSALTKEKRELLTFQTGNTSRFVQTDVIPLFRKAWIQSFAKKEKTKAAIAERGWNRLYYFLLDNPKLNPTITSEAFSRSLPYNDVLASIN